MKRLLRITLSILCFFSFSAVAQTGSYSMYNVKIYADGGLKAERELKAGEHILVVNEAESKITYGDDNIYKIVDRGTIRDDKNTVVYIVEQPTDNGETSTMIITIDSFFKLIRFTRTKKIENGYTPYFEFKFR